MKIGIVGYGRFAQTLIRLLAEPEVLVLTRSVHKKVPGVRFVTDSKIFYTSADTVFFCVPISSLEQTVRDHAPYINSAHTLLDVLSVKLHAKHVFDTHIQQDKVNIILTHPMFGPDSSRAGFAGLPIMMDQYRASELVFKMWTERFATAGLTVLRMSADEHDRMAARSQGVAHYVGRLLQEYGFQETPIDTVGAKKLKEIMDQVCHDTWQLYLDLQQYNPYSKEVIHDIRDAFDTLYKKTHIDNENEYDRMTTDGA